jgi:hypothetical protein
LWDGYEDRFGDGLEDEYENGLGMSLRMPRRRFLRTNSTVGLKMTFRML